MIANRLLSATAVVALLSTTTMTQALAQESLHGSVYKTKTGVCKAKTGTYLQRHPKVKGATVGAGVGAGAGAIAGLVSGKGMVRGAAIGAGTGAGVGLLQTSKTMKRHPLMKDMAEGTTAGVGLGLIANKGHGTGKKAMEAGAVGGALGLGAGFFKKELSK